MCKYCEEIEHKHFSNPKDGDLRVWWIPQVPMKDFLYPVQSVIEAKHVLDILAEYDLFQLEHKVKPDFSNVGGLQVFEDGEWLEWSNDDGESIDEVDENGNTLDE